MPWALLEDVNSAALGHLSVTSWFLGVLGRLGRLSF